jgi:hypothetical protein
MDGEAADVDQVITPVAIIDDGSVTGLDYTIAAQPDTCRLLDLTLVDTDLTAGTLTVTGTGCLGEPKVCAFAFTAGDDTGVATLTCTDGYGAYMSTVTEVETGTMTGESDETFALGYSVGAANGWPMYGRRMGPDVNGRYGIDPFGYYDVGKRITTSGVASTTVTGVTDAEDALAGPSAGDLLIVYLGGKTYERKILTNADADTITINQALNIPATGINYRYKRFFYSRNPDDLMVVPVHGADQVMFDWSIDANANTGGVVVLLECTADNIEFPGARWVQVMTEVVPTATVKANTTDVLGEGGRHFSYCRFGAQFGTGDDADVADEDINIAVSIVR